MWISPLFKLKRTYSCHCEVSMVLALGRGAIFRKDKIVAMNVTKGHKLKSRIPRDSYGNCNGRHF